MRWQYALWALVAVSLAASSSSLAQPASVADRVAKDHDMAMEHYDLGDYAAARKKLSEILAGLSRDNHGGSVSAAKTHVLLGVVHYKESQSDQAAKQYVRALQISAKVTLPKAYRDAGNQALFARARLTAHPPKATCDSLPGIAHTRVAGAKQGVSLKIESRVGNTLGAQTVVVMFRIDQGAFVELPLNKSGTCTYSGHIVGAQVKGRSLSYYVVARNKRGKAIARHGNAGNPIVVPVAQAAKSETVGKDGKPGDDEVPHELQVKTKRRGCGGCGGSPPGEGPLGFIVLFATAWLLQRRCVV